MDYFGNLPLFFIYPFLATLLLHIAWDSLKKTVYEKKIETKTRIEKKIANSLLVSAALFFTLYLGQIYSSETKHVFEECMNWPEGCLQVYRLYANLVSAELFFALLLVVLALVIIKFIFQMAMEIDVIKQSCRKNVRLLSAKSSKIHKALLVVAALFCISLAQIALHDSGISPHVNGLILHEQFNADEISKITPVSFLDISELEMLENGKTRFKVVLRNNSDLSKEIKSLEIECIGRETEKCFTSDGLIIKSKEIETINCDFATYFNSDTCNLVVHEGLFYSYIIVNGKDKTESRTN